MILPSLNEGFIMANIAVTHALPMTFKQCVRNFADEHDCPSPEMVQHELAAFNGQLKRHGWDVHVARHSIDLPDAVFAHDVACPFYGYPRSALLLLSMGHEQRQPEVERWPNFYRQLLPDSWDIVTIDDPLASIEGGDIAEATPQRSSTLRHPVYFVGNSSRTNSAGVSELRKVADRFGVEVVDVGVDSTCLHLETGATILRDEVLLDSRWVEPEPFIRQGFKIVPAVETWSANVLHLPMPNGKGVILASSRFPKTIEKLCKRGYTVIPLQLYGVQYGQGGPSCLVRMLSV